MISRYRSDLILLWLMQQTWMMPNKLNPFTEYVLTLRYHEMEVNEQPLVVKHNR